MNIYLLDANAVVFYLTGSPSRCHRIVDFLVQQRMVFHEATLFVPNFCIVEVFNALAKLRFDATSEHHLNPNEYDDCLSRFREHIHWAQVFYPYELNRYHVLAADDIIPWEQQLPRKEKTSKPAKFDRLSTLDILYLAMGMELAYLFGKEKVVLVTGDLRIDSVGHELMLARKEDREERRTPRDMLKGPAPWRWPAPRIFCLWGDHPSDLPCAAKQKPLNLGRN